MSRKAGGSGHRIRPSPGRRPCHRCHSWVPATGSSRTCAARWALRVRQVAADHRPPGGRPAAAGWVLGPALAARW